jgi:hypothetical protein
MYDIEMALDIYTDQEPIAIEPITYEELWYIRRYINTDTNGAGNTIILPMNSQWQELFEEKPQIYQPFYPNLRRHVLFTVETDDFGTDSDIEHMKLISFQTDKSWHRETILLNSDVMKIRECVQKIHSICLMHKNPPSMYEHLQDPISLELLIDPYIASDGITYSYFILWKLFQNHTPLSPMTRELLVRVDGCIGIQNKIIANLIDQLFLLV